MTVGASLCCLTLCGLFASSGDGREAYPRSCVGHISGSQPGFVSLTWGRSFCHQPHHGPEEPKPVDVGLSCPQRSQEGRGAPTSEAPVWWGERLSSGLQLHSSSWGRGFVNLRHLHLECSALRTPRSLCGRDWIFLVQGTARIGYAHPSICCSIQPSVCSIRLPACLRVLPPLSTCWG